MTGYDNYNRDAFNRAAEKLHAIGYVVLNPAVLPEGLTYAQYMDVDMAMVRACDIVALLPRAYESKGSRAETQYADCLGKRIVHIDELIIPTELEILGMGVSRE